MLTDMMLLCSMTKIIIVILIVFDGFITGFTFKEIKKYLVLILFFGYAFIVIAVFND